MKLSLKRLRGRWQRFDWFLISQFRFEESKKIFVKFPYCSRNERIQVNKWKFIYLNCGEWYEDMTDHLSYAHNLSLWNLWNCELTKWTAPRRLDSGIQVRPGFFQALISQLLKPCAWLRGIFLRSSNIWYFIYQLIFHFYSSSSTDILRTRKMTSSQMAW